MLPPLFCGLMTGRRRFRVRLDAATGRGFTRRVILMAGNPYRSTQLVGLLCMACLAAGCASQSPWSAKPKASKPPDLPSADSPAAGITTSATAPQEPTRHADATQMQEVMAELQRLGALDPAARDQLTADLQNTDPALWPGLLHQARAVAAYRQRAAQQQTAAQVTPAGYAATAMAPASAWPQFPPPPQPSGYPPADAAQHGVAPQPIDRLPVASRAAIRPDGAPQEPFPSTAFPHVDMPAGTEETRPLQSPPAAVPDDRAAPDTPAEMHSDDAASASAAAPSPRQGDGQLVSYTAEKELDWSEHVDSAIRLLEKSSGTGAEEQVRLRMLHLAKGQYDDAVRAMADLSASEQEFWSTQFHGLRTLLDDSRNPDAPGRTAEAKQVLAEAASQLGELAPLVVRNLAFCTRVHSYGCFEPFASYEFQPEQRVLLYAEVDNFTSESTARGYHTSLKSSYQLFDARGQRVADEELAMTEELCQNRRRDFFIVYDFHLPQRIFPGKHTLRLTIEDLKGKKIGDSCIDLEIIAER
ncbi:MAG: hypothetical protein RBS80_05270 [Thermoguttaceae bacterium]|nr:hypothetical protein [Thermoguttaceae bacterium]